MTRLSVNVNKIALIRNSRGSNLPNLISIVKDIIKYGAQGITVHPRPDERHIKISDVYDISRLINVEFNVEGYPSDNFINMILEVQPTQCTLVPDPPDALTSNQGWKIEENMDLLCTTVERLQSKGIRTSLFLDPKIESVKLATKTHTDRIEFYTGPYAEQYTIDREAAIQPYLQSAKEAIHLGLGINAGHDLNLDNLYYFYSQIPQLLEVSIGHALICDALYVGLELCIQDYLNCLR